MATFRIEQYELWAQTYTVEAAGEAEAIEKLYKGEAVAVDNSLEYIEADDDRGIPADEHVALAKALTKKGFGVGDVIPSIRDIEKGKRMILVFLQNAWAKNERSATWMRSSHHVWLTATARSRSGQRLRILLGEECFETSHIVFCNTTPEVGIGPSAKLPPKLEHIQSLLNAHRPDLVVTCGIQAVEAVAPLWGKQLLAVPHPANRVLTNALYMQGRRLIESGRVERTLLVQHKGYVETKELS